MTPHRVPDATLLARRLAEIERTLRHCEAICEALAGIEQVAGRTRVAAADARLGLVSLAESLRES